MLPTMGGGEHGRGPHRPVTRHRHGSRVLRRGRRARDPTHRDRRSGAGGVDARAVVVDVECASSPTTTSTPGATEYMLLSAPLVLAVPNGLDTRNAALTEPLAVGIHGVAAPASHRATPPWSSDVVRSASPSSPACAPWGGGHRGLRLLSGPARHGAELGATEVVDPARATGRGLAPRRRKARTRGFEAVGVPGMIQQLLQDVPPGTRVVHRGGLHGARPDPAVLRHPPRSCLCGSPWPTPPRSSPVRCARSPKAKWTCRP